MKKIAVISAPFLLGAVLFLLFAASTGSFASLGSPTPAPAAPAAPAVNIGSLPLNAPEEFVRPMESMADAGLQAQLEELLRSDPKLAAMVRSKRLSVGVVDMQDPFQARYAAVNGDHMMYAASLPKIAVLLASADALEQGDLAETPEVQRDMRLMIARSDNAATTRMIGRVGIDRIARVLQDPCYGLYDPQRGGGLWVGMAYGGGGKRIGDPLRNLSHAATANQVLRYYYKLAFGQLVSPARSRQMLDMLVDPQLHHKFMSVLDRVAPDARVYRKSGSWKQWHADSAMVWDEDRRYIVVALSEDPAGEVLLRQLMARLDPLLAPGA